MLEVSKLIYNVGFTAQPFTIPVQANYKEAEVTRLVIDSNKNFYITKWRPCSSTNWLLLSKNMYYQRTPKYFKKLTILQLHLAEIQMVLFLNQSLSLLLNLISKTACLILPSRKKRNVIMPSETKETMGRISDEMVVFQTLTTNSKATKMLTQRKTRKRRMDKDTEQSSAGSVKNPTGTHTNWM